MTFFIPFCCSIGKLCLLNFLFSLSLIPILILAKIQKREIYLKTSFQDFFHWKKKTSSLFHFSSTCTICTCVHSATNCFWNAKKFLNIKLKEFKIFKMDLHLPSQFVKTRLGNIIPSLVLIPFGYEIVSNSHSPHISDSILEQCIMCVYALN